jgi:hypothetical protein
MYVMAVYIAVSKSFEALILIIVVTGITFGSGLKSSPLVSSVV